MCAAAILSLASLIGAPTPPAAAPTQQLNDLVRKLGDKSYRTRETAARELLRQGSAAVSVLTEGAKDADPEVSERCRQLLPQAASLERTDKLNAFLKDLKAPPPKGLPGVENFLKITGDTKIGRELYAEMLAIHHIALEAAEDNPRKATEYYQQFCDEAYQRYQSGARTGRYSYDNMFNSRADITFFLVISGDARLRKNTAGVNRSYILLYGNQVNKALTEGESSETMRKLFLDWLGGDLEINLQQRGFMLAAQNNMKDAVPVILKMLEKPGQQTYAKAQVMIALAKLGGKEHLAKLEPYLSDKTVVASVNGTIQVQIRDVALGVSVLIAGQTLADYGFDARFGGSPAQYYHFSFPDSQQGTESKSRETALAKWRQWIEKNPSKK